jgi:iron complex transport system substrate-binding protein
MMVSREDARNAKAEQAEIAAALVVNEAWRLHRSLGPGLLESVYETVLAKSLRQRGLRVDRQRAVAFEFDGLLFEDGLRVDLLVDEVLVVEIKSIEAIAPVHVKQVLTYLRLLDLSLGLLINFNSDSFSEGCRRVVDRHPTVPGPADRSRRPDAGGRSVSR